MKKSQLWLIIILILVILIGVFLFMRSRNVFLDPSDTCPTTTFYNLRTDPSYPEELNAKADEICNDYISGCSGTPCRLKKFDYEKRTFTCGC